MARFFRKGKILQVNVSNGSSTTIWCRVAGDKILMVNEQRGANIGVPGVVVVGAQKANQYQHESGASRGYTQIQSGNTLRFEASTSSNSVYMTIVSETEQQICKNHEISNNRNYIIDCNDGLLEAKQKDVWTDTNGRNHLPSYDDESDSEDDDESDSEESSQNDYRTTFKPEEHFSHR